MYKMLETLAVALLGGALFNLINIPIPWMLGPLTAVMVWDTAFKREVFWPRELRNAGLAVLGFMMGVSFTRDTLAQITSQFTAMALVTVALILFSIFTGYITHKTTGISISSSMIGSVPGGLSQMIVLSEEIPDADITVVTFMQTLRLLSTLFVVPYLVVHGLADHVTQQLVLSPIASADYSITSPWVPIIFLVNVIFTAWAAEKIHMPTPFLLGPLLGTAILVVAGIPGFKVPPLISGISQLCIGTYMGTSMQLSSMKNWRKLFPYAVAGSIALIIFSLAVGIFLSYNHHLTMIDSFLSTAPGGMAEMGITALMVQGNVSLISAYHLFRVIFILLVMPPIIKCWMKNRTNQMPES